MSRKSSSSLSYEQAVSRLEEIVAAMEEGDLSLDQSLALFEEAIRLSRQCSSRLQEAAGQVEMLLKTDDGSLQTQEFDPEGGERD